MANHINPTKPNGAEAPSDAADAWTEAEAEALRILCEATGHVPGTNAFLGERSAHTAIVNSFYIYNDPIQYGGEALFAPRPGSVALKYTAVGQFLTRRDAQRWACKIALALPAKGRKNIQVFRLDNTGIGALKVESVPLGSEVKEREIYTLPLTFDLVFNLR